MKKTILFSVFFVCISFFGFAQIKVNSTGNIGIGTSSPSSLYKTTLDGGKLFMRFGNLTGGLEGTYVTNPGIPPTEVVDISPISGSYPVFQHTLGKYRPFSTGSFDFLFYNIALVNTSDARLKRNINALPFDRNAFSKLQPVSYEISSIATQKAIAEGENIKPFYTPQYGFIAQELQKIYPQLVLEDEETGYLKTKPLELIPVLVAAIQDQQKQIDELKKLIPGFDGAPELKLESGAAGEKPVSGITPGTAALYQNTPNPFSAETEIRFFLPDNVKQAYICIFDLQGTMLKKTNNLVGQSALIIQGSELKAGMYFYSLIVDGKEVDTKKMILTE